MKQTRLHLVLDILRTEGKGSDTDDVEALVIEEIESLEIWCGDDCYSVSVVPS